MKEKECKTFIEILFAICLLSSTILTLYSSVFQILVTVRKHFLKGGPKRLGYTLPPLIFSALKVVKFL